ncbi:hypothetical protein A4A49_03780, partial [Nicotiana attenuata]
MCLTNIAALEVIEEGNEQNNQLAIVEGVQEVAQVEINSPVTERNSGTGTRSPKKTSPKNNRKGLNPTAPIFNPVSKGSEAAKQGRSTSPTGRRNGEPINKESTSQWVHQAFAGNFVATNISYQEVPSHDTKVEKILAKEKKTVVDAEVEASEEVFTSMERIKWTGGRLWGDQIEEDPDEGVIPDRMQAERDSDVDVEEDEKSVNGEDKLNKHEELVSKEQVIPKPTDGNKEITGEAPNSIDEIGIIATDAGNLNIATVNPKDINVNECDPGGKGNDLVPKEINKEMGGSAICGNKQEIKEQANMERISTVPLGNSQVRQQQHGEKSIIYEEQAKEIDTD